MANTVSNVNDGGFGRLFNDPKVLGEGPHKVYAAIPEPTFYGTLDESMIPTWMAWNIGSWLRTRGLHNPRIVIAKIHHLHEPRAIFDIDIVLHQKGEQERYRVLVTGATTSVRISIITCTDQSNRQPTVQGDFGEINLVTWTSSVLLQ